MATKKTRTRSKAAKKPRSTRSVDDRIKDLKEKIRELEARRAARELAREPVFKQLRTARSALARAVALMDGRTSKLGSDFIRASRRYLNLLERELDAVIGKKRRGRKPKADLGK